MPFDALVAVTPRRALSDALDRLNLEPVSWEELKAHKQAQQQKFGPSFWYRHQAALSISLIFASPAVGVIVGAAQGFSPHSSTLAIASSFVWMCIVALITGTGLVRLCAGSQWEERLVPANFLGGGAVPEPIARVARALQHDVPDAAVIVGELKREEVVLDPYLLLEHGDKCVPGHLGGRAGNRLCSVARAERTIADCVTGEEPGILGALASHAIVSVGLPASGRGVRPGLPSSGSDTIIAN